MRKSQAIAAFRNAKILELNNQLDNEIVPAFNAEVADIKHEWEEGCKNLSIGEALADHKKRARVSDMLVRRKEFIDSLQTCLKMEMNERIKEYGGEIQESEKDGKKVLLAQFPDGSIARVPKSLWINYDLFHTA